MAEILGSDGFAAQQFILLCAASIGIGACVGAVVGANPLEDALDGAVYGSIIGAPLAFIESYESYLPSPRAFRRWPYGLKLAVRSISYAAWIVAAAMVAGHLTHAHEGEGLADLLHHRENLMAAVIAAVVINIVMGANRLLGPGVFIRFLSGRYREPRREDRTFLMLDLCDSTGIAERIGDLRFHRYVDDVWQLAEREALLCGAEIHDYIGDQIILTWKGRPPRAGGPLQFVRRFSDLLERRSSRLEAKHGAKIRFRAVIHSGFVVVGEMGRVRRKICLMGDTINTTARLEHVARDRAEPLLITRRALERWPQVPGMGTRSLGLLPLRGKSELIEVLSVQLMKPLAPLKPAPM